MKKETYEFTDEQIHSDRNLVFVRYGEILLDTPGQKRYNGG